MKKKHPNLLRYSLFLAVLLKRIQEFLLRSFYLSGTMAEIMAIDLHVLGLQLPVCPKIHELQEKPSFLRFNI